MTTLTKSQFAKRLNVKPGYVTQLQNAGRLVMDGTMINVEASIERIAQTRDPSKLGVAERHEQDRQQQKTPPELPLSDKAGLEASGSAYQQAKAVKEKYNALAAKRDYEIQIKQLLHVDDVRAAVMDGDVIIRSRLESLPDRLAPMLAAESDEQRIRALLIEQIEYLLSELSGSFKKLVNG